MNFPPQKSDGSSWLDNPAPAEYVSPLTGARESERLGAAQAAGEPVQVEGGIATAVSQRLKPLEFEATDFETLKRSTFTEREALVPRTLTDNLLDTCIPVLIFLMVGSIVFYLLDVRYVYTSMHDVNLRFVAVCFLIGVVALNRLIARDGQEESFLYMLFLAAAIGFYTFLSTGAYGVGSVARNFMNTNPFAATAFNMGIVAFLWWVTNRLTHECCVDENKTAGDIGILTGTARRFQESIRRDPKAKQKKPIFVTRKAAEPDRWIELSAYDPSEGPQQRASDLPSTSKPLPETVEAPKRHPGISIFYFSVPVMLAFALGLRVIQHGGQGYVLVGWFYLILYAFSALMLLQLSSLAGLREYFRARRVQMPAGIGTFWIGLGTLMVLMVLFGAASLPMPTLPPLAHVDKHEQDPWARGADALEIQSVAAKPVELIRQTQIVTWIGRAVLVVIIGFAIFAAIKALALLAGVMGRQRDRWPPIVIWFFDALDRFLSRITRIPVFSFRPAARKIDRELATCVQYRSTLAEDVDEKQRPRNPGYHVEYAYEALCALANDLGVPRRLDQTPYEFIQAFPRELAALKEDALALTRLYVMAAYSGEEVDPRVEKTLRKFWLEFNRVRARVIR